MRETVDDRIKSACVLRYGEGERSPWKGKQRTKSGGGVRSRQKKQATGCSNQGAEVRSHDALRLGAAPSAGRDLRSDGRPFVCSTGCEPDLRFGKVTGSGEASSPQGEGTRKRPVHSLNPARERWWP